MTNERNDLPKPPVEDLPSDKELEDMDPPGEEEVAGEEFMNPEEARDDDTVDDEELDEEGP
jgi:hypothetical protein